MPISWIFKKTYFQMLLCNVFSWRHQKQLIFAKICQKCRFMTIYRKKYEVLCPKDVYFKSPYIIILRRHILEYSTAISSCDVIILAHFCRKWLKIAYNAHFLLQNMCSTVEIHCICNVHLITWLEIIFWNVAMQCLLLRSLLKAQILSKIRT